MIQLIPMNEDDFKNFIILTDEEHARERMKTDFQTYEEALAITKSIRIKMLSSGLNTPKHFFFNTIDDSKKTLGSVWLCMNTESSEAFLYYIYIQENERRKGYGKQTMLAIEKLATENGVKVMWLNVFGHNHGARKLYEGCGFNEAAVHMNKLLL